MEKKTTKKEKQSQINTQKHKTQPKKQQQQQKKTKNSNNKTKKSKKESRSEFRRNVLLSYLITWVNLFLQRTAPLPGRLRLSR